MTKYLIYTSNDIEPFVIETDEDLFDKYIHAMNRNQPTLFIKHEKNLDELGFYKYKVLLNTQQIVSITEEKKE